MWQHRYTHEGSVHLLTMELRDFLVASLQMESKESKQNLMMVQSICHTNHRGFCVTSLSAGPWEGT